jgi:hypothetical protein
MSLTGFFNQDESTFENVIDSYMNQSDSPQKGPPKSFEVCLRVGGDSESEPGAEESNEESSPSSRSQVQPDEDHKTTNLVQDPTGPIGQLYQGQWVDDFHSEEAMKHGSGILHVPLTTGHLVYRGEFFLNKKHGRGVMEWEDGRQYQGQFLDDDFHGEGVMKWPDGRQYIGQYANGRKEGAGTCYFPDGSTYRGQFHKGKRHGEIVYVKADGSTKLCHFKMDKVYKAEKVVGDGDEPSPTNSDCTTDVTSVSRSSSHVETLEISFV